MSQLASDFLAACMSKGEQKVLRKQLSKSVGVLEFGIGGSTGIASEYDLKRLVGIDSHPDWILKCYNDPRIKSMRASERVKLHHVDIGPVKEWGFPVEQSEKWQRYSLGIWPELEGWEPDFVFIDGRFRLSCACQSLLRLPNLPAIGLHDFWSRPHYHPILEFTEVVEREDELVILAPRADMDVRKLGILASETLFDPR